MRCAFTAVLTLLCCAILAGCSVVEVIDNLGEPTTPGGEKIEKPSNAPAPDSGQNGNARAKLRAYYERERSSSAKDADPDNPIVRCMVRGKSQNLRKYDCEIRGGRALS